MDSISLFYKTWVSVVCVYVKSCNVKCLIDHVSWSERTWKILLQRISKKVEVVDLLLIKLNFETIVLLEINYTLVKKKKKIKQDRKSLHVAVWHWLWGTYERQLSTQSPSVPRVFKLGSQATTEAEVDECKFPHQGHLKRVSFLACLNTGIS